MISFTASPPVVRRRGFVPDRAAGVTFYIIDRSATTVLLTADYWAAFLKLSQLFICQELAPLQNVSSVVMHFSLLSKEWLCLAVIWREYRKEILCDTHSRCPFRAPERFDAPIDKIYKLAVLKDL